MRRRKRRTIPPVVGVGIHSQEVHMEVSWGAGAVSGTWRESSVPHPQEVGVTSTIPKEVGAI
jgi:hypothetical protein